MRMPSVMEASATLKGGQPRGSLMKSVTEPWRTTVEDVAQGPAHEHARREPDQGLAEVAGEVDEQGDEGDRDEDRHKRSGRRGGSRRRHRCCGCGRARCRGGSDPSSPTTIECSTARLLSWSATRTATAVPPAISQERTAGRAGDSGGRRLASAAPRAQPWMMPWTTTLLTICSDEDGDDRAEVQPAEATGSCGGRCAGRVRRRRAGSRGRRRWRASRAGGRPREKSSWTTMWRMISSV